MSAPTINGRNLNDETQPLTTEHLALSDVFSPGRPTVPPVAGRLVYSPPPPHQCHPPVNTFTVGPSDLVLRSARICTEPAAPDGAVWECLCGRHWTAAPTRRWWRPPGRHAERRRWRPARRAEIRRAHRDHTPPATS